MKTVRVEASTPYDVIIGYGQLAALGTELAKRHALCRVALVADETALSHYGEAVRASLVRAGFTVLPCPIPPGEKTKTLETVAELLERFARSGLMRGDIVVALGGGVTGDVAGFAAATYLRGVAFVQVPTTLLAAVDSSIGGKSGVNLEQGKNLAGAFWQPLMVLCDCDTFETLPRNAFLDGVAESLKYGVACDRSLFELVSRGALDEDCVEPVARCVQIKARLVAADERDNGERHLLNFGHTIGHAIESLSGYSIPHGHAVAMGMAGMTRMAEALELCVMGCAGILLAMLDRLDLPSEIPYEADELARVAMADKKRQGDMVTLVLPESIGHCVLYPVRVSELPRLFRMAKGERW